MGNFSSKKLFKVLLVVIASGLLVFFNPEGFFDPIKSVLGKVSHPFKKISYSASYGIDSVKDFVFSIGKIKNENIELLKKNQELSVENAKFHEMEKENNFLREQLEILPRKEFYLEAAFIIGQDPQGLGNFMEINKGLKQGIKEGMAVVISKGIIVGRIEKVFSDSSIVILLTNPKSVMGISVVQSGAKGIVKGEYGLGISIDSILQTDSIEIGNEIITSGTNKEIPKGLLVGIVQETKMSSDHLYKQAIVDSPVDVSELDIVFVLKGEKNKQE